MKSPRGLTPYQLEILRHLQGADPTLPLDFDQLLEKLSWAPSKESAQFSFRALVTKGLIAKSDTHHLRRGRKRVCYLLTAAGAQALDPRLVAEKLKATPPDGEKGAPAPVVEVSTDLAGILDAVPGILAEPALDEVSEPITLFSIEE